MKYCYGKSSLTLCSMEGQHYLLFLPSKKILRSILFLQCVSTNLVLVKIRSRIYFDNFLLKFFRRLICYLTVEGYQCLIWYHKTGLLFVYWLGWFQTPLFGRSNWGILHWLMYGFSICFGNIGLELTFVD